MRPVKLVDTGATLPVTFFPNLESWLDELYQRVIDDAAGTLEPSTPGHSICVAYVIGNGTTAETMKKTQLVGGHASSSPCFFDGDRPEPRVQVRIERPHEFEALFFRTTIDIGTEAVARYEIYTGSG